MSVSPTRDVVLQPAFLTVQNDDTVSIEWRTRRSEAPRRTVSMPSWVLGWALAFLLRRSLHQLSLRAAPRHRPFPPEADQPRAEPDSALERSPLDRSYT